MAFINEYISEEDIKKYDIRGIWRKFDRCSSDEERDAMVGRYSWTIDRGLGIFFIPISNGKEEFSNQKICALWWRGHLLRVTIANMGSEFDHVNRTGHITWGLADIWKPEGFHISNSEIISVLKDALTIYQLHGIWIPMNSYKVDFNF